MKFHIIDKCNQSIPTMPIMTFNDLEEAEEQYMKMVKSLNYKTLTLIADFESRMKFYKYRIAKIYINGLPEWSYLPLYYWDTDIGDKPCIIHSRTSISTDGFEQVFWDNIEVTKQYINFKSNYTVAEINYIIDGSRIGFANTSNEHLGNLNKRKIKLFKIYYNVSSERDGVRV